MHHPRRLPSGERSGRGGDRGAALSRSVGAWSTATINNRLDTMAACQGLTDRYIFEMDRTYSTIERSLQTNLDALDFSPYLKEVETPTLLPVGEESPTSSLDEQRFMAQQLADWRLGVYSGLGHGINAIHQEWCTQQIREFVASLTI